VPCPEGVNIPSNFALYNEGLMYDKPDQARGGYGWMLQSHKLGISASDGRAINCIQCGECEPKCPQGILISELMPIMHEVLGEGKSYADCPLP
jgi:hypothetical protein